VAPRVDPASAAKLESMTPPLNRPTWDACRLLAERLWEPLPVRFAPAGPDVVVVGRANDVTLSLSVRGEPVRAFLEVVGEGFRLRGFTDVDEVRVFAIDPVIFGGIAVPFATTPLRVVGHQDGEPLLRLPADDGLDVPAPLEQVVPCRQLAIASGHTRAHPELKNGELATVTRFPLPLALQPHGKPAASLIDEPPRAALLLGRAQGQARIALHGNVATYFGWVDGTAVKPGTSPPGIGGTSHHTSMGGAIRGPVTRWRCTDDLPLVGAIDSKRMILGTISAGTVWKGTESRDGLVDAHLPGLRHATGRLAVEEPLLASCTSVR
jgi:hypothetical protein